MRNPGNPTLREYLAILPGRKVESFAAARRFYVDYHCLLCASGSYSSVKIAASMARALGSGRLRQHDAPSGNIVVYDGAGASGLRTLQDRGLEPLVDLRPGSSLRHLPWPQRTRVVAGLMAAAASPPGFFERLFDAYATIAGQLLEGHTDSRTVVAANERSLGCAPFLAAAKFIHGRTVAVVQHGNPIGDYLPTFADEYWCRSDRWYEYLLANALVPQPRRIDDFPGLEVFEYNPSSRTVVLLLHNVGYLEPEVDYRQLTRQVEQEVRRAGYALQVLPHPANQETFGLPVVDRRRKLGAALALGYRSTVVDQLPRELPRISLIDYWPEFFLIEGRPALLDDFLSRIREALT